MKKSLLAIFSTLSKKERKTFVLSILFEIGISTLDILFLGLLVFIINFYTQDAAINQKAPFFSFISLHPYRVLILFFIGYSIKNGLAYLLVKGQYRFVYAVAARLSRAKLEAYFLSDYESYVHIDSSIQVHKINQRPIEFGHYIVRGWQQVIGQAVLVLIAVTAIGFYDARLLLMLMVAFLPPVVLAGYFIKRKAGHLRSGVRQAGEKSLQFLTEALAGLIESKIYFGSEFFTDRYTSRQNKLNRLLADQQIIQALPSRLIEVFAVLGLLLLIIFHHTVSLSVVTIGAFMASAYKIIPGMVKILNGLGQVKAYEFVLNDLINGAAKEPLVSKDVFQIHSLQCSQVSFSYTDKNIISGFDLSIAKGDFVGISGFSGKGKTTLVNLLLGFLPPDEGAIFINGLPLKKINRESFWQRVSYVKQQPFLIHDTAFLNVVLQETGYNEERFNTVSERTGFKSFNGAADKIIRENGKNISGGQRQRIAMARALYKDFDLLVLDEPFSEMEETSEINMLEQLKELSKEGKIIILITHNKSSLTFCNKTVLMDE